MERGSSCVLNVCAEEIITKRVTWRCEVWCVRVCVCVHEQKNPRSPREKCVLNEILSVFSNSVCSNVARRTKNKKKNRRNIRVITRESSSDSGKIRLFACVCVREEKSAKQTNVIKATCPSWVSVLTAIDERNGKTKQKTISINNCYCNGRENNFEFAREKVGTTNTISKKRRDKKSVLFDYVCNYYYFCMKNQRPTEWSLKIVF